MDLKYKQLSIINNEMFSYIKRIFIFSKFDASDVIFLTKNDEVYGFGKNSGARLGLGHCNTVKEPTLIPELSSKQVINIEFSSQFMVALTQTNEVFTCGYEHNGMLGTGKNSKTYRKPQKINLKYKLIVDIKCRTQSTYLLTNNNEVYWFGNNSDKTTVNYPTLINELCGQKIIEISCGYDHTLALTNSGYVYSRGINKNGQLGLDHTNITNAPQIIKLRENIYFNKISAGQYHSLLLTTNGIIYAFGNNKEYQLGIENFYDDDSLDDDFYSPSNYSTPKCIKFSEEFIDIYAFGNTSMALSQCNVCIWGMNLFKTPFIVNLSGFQEAIDMFSSNAFTYKPLSPQQVFYSNDMSRMTKTMAKAFNNPKKSDLKFKLKHKGSEDKFNYIYCHKWFIKENSEYFEKMFANNWSENKTNEIQINDFSYEAFFHFIRCLYTDSIETKNMEILIELLSITVQYLDEEMKSKCVHIIKSLLNVENVCSIYSASLRYRSKDLEEFCIRFISINMNIIRKTEDYKKLNENDLKEFIAKYFK